MVAVNINGLPQVGGYNRFADIEHGIAHLLNAMDQEQTCHQILGMFSALQSRGVFFYPFLAGLVHARLDAANLECQRSVITTDRLFNPVKPAADLPQHEFTGARARATPVLQLIQLLDRFTTQAGDTL